MDFQQLTTHGDICQALTLALSLAAYIPQWYTLTRTKCVENISVRSWYLWLLSALLAWFYSLVQFKAYSTGIVLFATNTAIVLCIITTLALLSLYRKKRLA